MEKKIKTKNIKTFAYIMFLSIIFFGFLSLISFGERIRKDIFLSTPQGKTNIRNLSEKFKYYQSLIKISENIKNKKFTFAKVQISGDTSENYFNLGTIKLLEAYHLVQKDNLLDSQQARKLIAQAYKDLDIAEKVQIDPILEKNILNNKRVAENLSLLIETKTCYREGGIIISEIENSIMEAENIIDEQSRQLENMKKIMDSGIISGNACLGNLSNIITNNQVQLKNLRNDLSNKLNDYKNILSEKLNSPIKCRGTSFEEAIKKTLNAQESMKKYLEEQQKISQILENPSEESLNQLCNGSKNDSQISENLSSSISQMMKDLQNQSEKEKNKSEKNEDNKQDPQKNGEEKQEGNQEKDGKKSKEGEEKEKTGGNGESEYKDILNQEERNILNQSETNSKKLIQQIQKIKGEGLYNGKEYIKNIFNSFMGNEGDFENLHENGTKTEINTKTNATNQNNGIIKTQRY